MRVFDHPEFDHHQQIVFGCDEASGLRAIIAIHDTRRGPALGGLRIYPYADEDDALTDVLRLSRGMTYKSALADLPLGGGKAVIIANPRTDKTPALLRAMGRLVESLGGRYITAEDSGSGEEDMRLIREETRHVSGLGHDGESGDPSPFTAHGVFCAMKSAVRYCFGRDDMKGLRVAIQGVGHVGAHLARELHEAGAQLVLTDVDRDSLGLLSDELGALSVAPEEIFDAEVDVFAPCAMGAVLTEGVAGRLRARAICGAANNQLATPVVAELLHRRGILYTPDYVANAGGVIEVEAQRHENYDRDAVMRHVERIAATVDEILARAQAQDTSPAGIADQLARERLQG
ncbi:MAG: amino acid dehydrogenase [Halomonas sp.]|jgi:leucine dehydrogenase|uniref:Glu/Leu/Phe/Val dehydrogenase n=1 Tax=Billgrantia tianxiuensis TaxID=2497861 RepID=A0A6I6SQS4_9GAMM|nr:MULTISPECIES: Glu/Leu/Phe/Val dehydrogenase dimerization domain-containing protein [Halomonas]MCE8031687.1 Glu/Leu/Phe/Val dehydrogenase [Halomonas sp. MCCC 1A11057]MDX5433548.1 amino acid dehydrogenase [Halomonas sp.]MDX5503161.1 amino acid dehydrogenase [Halomonas sp.]QHC50180.1 Glu/Leu/Phe/Val dehydrogenase [Halomonas tianxiuensis]